MRPRPRRGSGSSPPLPRPRRTSPMHSSQRALRDLPALRDLIDGEVVTPADDRWDDARRPWNFAHDQRPELVAFPESAEDVVAIVQYASRNGLRVAPQGTGHNAGPLGSLDGTILLSTSRMRGVSVDAEARSARVAAGTLWLEVTEASSAARPRPAFGLLARRRRRRLLAGRRRELARPQARPGRQQHPRDRARDRRRAPAPGRRRQRPRALLGAARRRRQLRRRDRDGDRALPATPRSTPARCGGRGSARPRSCTPGASGR